MERETSGDVSVTTERTYTSSGIPIELVKEPGRWVWTVVSREFGPSGPRARLTLGLGLLGVFCFLLFTRANAWSGWLGLAFCFTAAMLTAGAFTLCSFLQVGLQSVIAFSRDQFSWEMADLWNRGRLVTFRGVVPLDLIRGFEQRSVGDQFDPREAYIMHLTDGTEVGGPPWPSVPDLNEALAYFQVMPSPTRAVASQLPPEERFGGGVAKQREKWTTAFFAVGMLLAMLVLPFVIIFSTVYFIFPSSS